MIERQTAPEGRPPAAVRRPLALTRAGMVLERALRAFWPLGSVLALVLALQSFDLAGVLGRALGPAAVLALLGAVALAVLLALGLGLWRFRWPTRGEALARLDATLPGRPLAALGDHLALGAADPASRALWQAHLARMQARLAQAHAVAPDPDLARRDPFGLRLSALTALIVALIFGAPARVLEPAVLPGLPGRAEAAMGPSWEGWAEPPAYTGKPSLYLNRVAGDHLVLPEGTRLSFRFYGQSAAKALSETVSSPAALPAGPVAGQTGVDQASAGPEAAERRDFIALRSGVITVTGPAGRHFRVDILPDDPPDVALLGAAERRADGRFVQGFHAHDDYAVQRGQARISLDLAAVDRRFGRSIAPEPRPDLVLDLPLPFSGSRADFSETLNEDLSRNAWANLPVRLQLSVEDGRAQQAQSPVLTLDLPGRRFFDPLAAALIEARADLLWNRANAARVAQWLRAISNRPQDLFHDADEAQGVQSVIAALESGPLAGDRRDALAAQLWDLAVAREDGGLSDALAEMQRARARLSEAMRNGASQDEIDALMRALKEATDKYLRLLAERSKQEQDQGAGGSGQSRQITGDQIQQMMDEIQRLMEEGRMSEAQELLDQLSRMLQNLRVTQGTGQGSDGLGQGQGEGSQSMQDLRDTLRRQQDLSDKSFRSLQERAPGGGSAQPPSGDPGQGGSDGSGQGGSAQGGGDLAGRQRALRQELGRQQGLLPQYGTPEGDESARRLDEAGRAMEQAERALREGNNAQALDRQADAIEALREGMRSLDQAMQRDQGKTADGQQATQGGQPGGAGHGGVPGRDPLGRETGNGARIGGDGPLAQGETGADRAQELLEELRRRSGERQRSREELEYLRRLLEQF